MAYPHDTASYSTPFTDEDRGVHPTHQTGIGFTQWLALGLLALTILMVILAIVMNLILGTPGN